jgi:outer membrane protein TolC
MIKKIIFLIIGGMFFVPQAHAVSLEEMTRLAWQKSAFIQAQKSQYEITAGDRWRRFFPLEPQIYYLNSDDDTARSIGLNLTTGYPFKNFLLTGLDAARENVEKTEVDAKKYDLTLSMAALYLDCAVATQSAGVQQKTIDDIETTSRLLKALYESGLATQAENISSQLQIRQAQLDLAALQDRAAVACQKLESVMDDLGTADHEVLLADNLENQFIADLGDVPSGYGRATAAVTLAKANYDVAGWQQLPDINLSYQKNDYVYLPGSPSGKPSASTYGIAMTLPLFFPLRETIEMNRSQNQAVLNQKAAELDLLRADTEIKQAKKEYQRSKKRLVEIREKDIPLATALVESTYSAYKAGKLGFAELVLSRKTLSDLRLQDIQLRSAIVQNHLKCLNQCE